MFKKFMNKEFMHKDITREVMSGLAISGLIISSLLTIAGVTVLGVRTQVAFAQATLGYSDSAAVIVAEAMGLSEAQVQPALGALSIFNVDGGAMATTAAASAQSSSLSETQIQAVVGLLASFDVNEATISNVSAVLRNNSTGSNVSVPKPGMLGSTEHPTGTSGFSTATGPSARGPYPTGPCTVPTGTLESGMRGTDVSMLQSFLVSQGYMASGSINGFFGTTTEDALKHWQDKQGIASLGNVSSIGLGVFGPRTRSAMAGLCKPLPQPPHVGTPMDTTGPRGFEGKPGIASSSVSTEVPAPTCTLTSTQASSSPNTVKITWTSTNALYASSPNGGNDPVNGSRVVTVSETTIFKKTVYGKGGSGTCYITVPVGNADGSTPASTTPPTTPPIVQALAPAPAPASADINLASVAAAVAQLPFSIAIDSLANIFVQLGVGQ